MDLSILKALGIVDCVVLVQKSKGVFKLEEDGGNWLHHLLPQAMKRQKFTLGDTSIFLQDFLLDAEAFWTRSEDATLNSGIWTEQNKDITLYLEAIATSHQNKNYLIIKNVEQVYYERRQTLQIARELSLSNEAIVERHDYLNQRLQSILKEATFQDTTFALHEAIKYASIGVLIADAKLNVEIVNPRAFEVFDMLDNKDDDFLLATIAKIVLRQYPEKDLFNDNQAFSGELFLHSPPMASKWLSINVRPVFDKEAKIAHWIISFSDQTRIKHLLQTNEELALQDALTGLPNRQYFWQYLQQMVSLKKSFSLLKVDIANFKYQNELHGYPAGDELLIETSKRLKSILAEDDFVSRIGADEFMIISSNPSQYEDQFEQDGIAPTNVLAQLISDECEQPFNTKNNRRAMLSVKLGTTCFPDDANTAEELLNCAELALAEAKFDSPSMESIVNYNKDLKTKSNRRLFLAEALNQAIEKRQLELYFQPIYDLNSKQIIKAEALLRWHLNGTIIYPDEFIGIAENSDSINAIGRWVFQELCFALKELEKLNVKIPMSVNFSPKQIYDVNLMGFISMCTRENAVDASLIEIEITENVLIKDYKRVSLFLNAIKNCGMSISVDDFGCGYSSLAYLKHLPIDALKIDRSFIQDIDTNSDDRAIVSAIVALAKELKLAVIAEGIEREEQQQVLLSQNCSRVQGFLYSKAVPFNDLLALVKT